MICLIPPESLRKEFMRVADHAPQGSVIQPEGELHITLGALHIPKKRSQADLLQRLEKIKFPAFNVNITDVDTFNRAVHMSGRSKVAWFRPDGVSGNDIQELSNRINAALREPGYMSKSPDVRPHMTILRYDFHMKADEIRGFLKKCAAQNFPEWKVDRFYLTRRRSAGEIAANDNSAQPDESAADYDPEVDDDDNDVGSSSMEIIASFPLAKPS